MQVAYYRSCVWFVVRSRCLFLFHVFISFLFFRLFHLTNYYPSGHWGIINIIPGISAVHEYVGFVFISEQCLISSTVFFVLSPRTQYNHERQGWTKEEVDFLFFQVFVHFYLCVYVYPQLILIVFHGLKKCPFCFFSCPRRDWESCKTER